MTFLQGDALSEAIHKYDMEDKKMGDSTQLELVRKDVSAMLAEDYALLKDTIEAIEIKSDEDMKGAGNFRAKVNSFCKKIEEKRKNAVDPFNKLVKEINAEYKQASTLFERLLGALDGKIKPYLTEVARRKEAWAKEQREKELAEMARKQKDLEALAVETDGKEVLDMAISVEEEKKSLETKEIVVHKSVKSEEISTAIIDNWKSRVVDADKVPRSYCSPDEKKLKAAVKTNEAAIKAGTFKIEGVEFWNDSYLGSYKR